MSILDYLTEPLTLPFMMRAVLVTVAAAAFSGSWEWVATAWPTLICEPIHASQASVELRRVGGVWWGVWGDGILSGVDLSARVAVRGLAPGLQPFTRSPACFMLAACGAFLRSTGAADHFSIVLGGPECSRFSGC